MDSRLAHVENWIFDLDNCLYPASCGLFALIDRRMNAYIRRLLDIDEAEAHRVQKSHFLAHGTTLAGLMATHDVDPRDFMTDVHAIPLDRVARDERLAAAIARLPGRKFVHTNGEAGYAHAVLDRLGIADAFAAVHDLFAADLRPKPDPHGYAALLAAHDIDPTRAAMVEDMARNLAPAKALGMVTIWVDNGSEAGDHGHDPAAIDFTIPDLADWLDSLTATC